MRKRILFISIMAMMLGSCVHRARDRRITEVITDSMHRGEFAHEYGWVQDVKLLKVQKISVQQRLKHNIDYYRYMERRISNDVKAMAVEMDAAKEEIQAWKDTLASYRHMGRNTDTVKWHLQQLAIKTELLKWEIANNSQQIIKNIKTADSMQALKVDGDKFGGYYIWLAYTRVKEGMKIPDTTARLVTEDWRCQSMIVSK